MGDEAQGAEKGQDVMREGLLSVGFGSLRSTYLALNGRLDPSAPVVVAFVSPSQRQTIRLRYNASLVLHRSATPTDRCVLVS